MYGEGGRGEGSKDVFMLAQSVCSEVACVLMDVKMCPILVEVNCLEGYILCVSRYSCFSRIEILQ